ncbi:MAG: GTP-binding protein, partial [Nitrospinota bacterium]
MHQPRSVPGKDRIVLVGPPNVGKSVIFHALTGAYVTVSNYPGTTVEITQGLGTFDHTEYEVIDTPGLHSLLPLTAEEEITRTLLFTTTPTAVVHVIDAKNLEKLLPLTLQLLEAELPVLLNLNLLDEAERVGMHIDSTALEQELGIPVAATVATTGQGITTLRQKIAERAQQPVSPSPPLTYP